MKRAKLLGIIFICVFAVIYSTCDNPVDKLQIVDTERSITGNLGEYSEHLMAYTADIEKISRELLGNVIIGSQEFLFNLDESPDFIYVDFTNSGYAVFAAESLELLEFAAQGSLPYQNTRRRRYYNGPKGYFTKINEQFVNEVTNESFAISTSEARASSQAIRQTFSISESELELVPENNNGELIVKVAALSGNNKSKIDTSSFIQGTDAFNETYINNSNYFLTNPMHGWNKHGTCGSVAAQLLLSYNNYYNDRRIIAPEHLNGEWHNVTGNNNINDPNNYTYSEQNPNACLDPMDMTHETTGSNDAFYNALIKAIEPALNGSNNTKVIDGMKNILNGRNVSYSTNSYTINLANVKAQINSHRPVIIEMRESLGGVNHYVVAYGYGDYKYPDAEQKNPGYIVHFGWDETGIGYAVNVWINSAWCRSYITMQINHTHTYVSTGTVLNRQEMILNCTTCNHRKNDTISNVSGNTVTGLKYALTHTASISIPTSINDVHITAIGSYVFENQTNINSVTIPNTVTRVGENAFLNTGIWNSTANNNVVYADKWAVGYRGNVSNTSGTLTLLSGTVGIGDNAFSQVSGVKEIIIPNSVNNIGTGAFSNNSAFERIWIPSSVTIVDSMAFAACPSLTIYVQAASKPNGWHMNWNRDNRPVIWGSPAAYINIFSGGSGTENDPYIITTVEHLNNLRNYSGFYYKLGNNINLPNTPWTPIQEFNGHLDGNGYAISNLNMTFTDGVQINDNFNDCIVFGLFVKNRGTINNLKVTSNINLTNIPSNYTLPQGREIIVGTIAAINYGTIMNSTVSASSGNPMINSTIHVYNVVGGITGYNYAAGNVTSCTNDGAIQTSGNTGGIIGINYGATGSCTNNALIRYTYINENRGIGGIVGVNSGNITSGTNNGAISYANSSSNSHLIQPLMAHIAGNNFYGIISDTFYSCGGTVNPGALQTVNYTSGGVTQTHNQALYTGNRVLGSGYIGNGTVSNPFIIITPENIKDMQHRNAYYKQANNIDLQNITWTPVPQFDGIFNGNGYTISNLNMTFTNSLLVDNRSISYGLIAVNNGTINNMRVTANINLTNIPGNYSLPQNREIVVGVIAAENNGIIQNSFVSSGNSNPMINSIIHVRNKTGGITGNNNAAGRIISCTNNGTIYSNGGTGGIIGNNQGTVSSCTNGAKIYYTYVNENRGVGGIVGENSSGSVTGGTNNNTIYYNNTNTGTNISVQPYMAHIVGYRINGAVSGSFNFSSGAVNLGTLQTITYTSGGVTQTHNQAFFVGSRVTGRDPISGSGTANSPYIISAESHLIYLRQFPAANFRLENNINMSYFGSWTPIPEFTGVFEGNSKTITNLNMTFSNSLLITNNLNNCVTFGLFALNRGTIRNLNVTANINLTANIPTNYSLPQGREIVTGVIAAVNHGTIQNTTVSASGSNPMINSTIPVYNVVGGVAGYAYATGNITSCTNNGAIHSSGNTGGIIGINFGTPSACVNNGTINYTYINDNRGIGGIAGVNSGVITSGTNNGTISYANSSNNSNLIQPSMAHIAGRNSYGSANGAFNFNSGYVNRGALQTVTYTSGGVTQTHNQALYVGSRAVW